MNHGRTSFSKIQQRSAIATWNFRRLGQGNWGETSWLKLRMGLALGACLPAQCRCARGVVWGGWSVGWVLVWSGLSRLSVCLSSACSLCRGHGPRSERTTLSTLIMEVVMMMMTKIIRIPPFILCFLGYLFSDFDYIFLDIFSIFRNFGGMFC